MTIVLRLYELCTCVCVCVFPPHSSTFVWVVVYPIRGCFRTAPIITLFIPGAPLKTTHLGGTLAHRARAGHLFGLVPHQWPFRGCTKGAHLAQCSYLGVWLY